MSDYRQASDESGHYLINSKGDIRRDIVKHLKEEAMTDNKSDVDEKELIAYGGLVKKKMTELKGFGDLDGFGVACVQTTFLDKDDKQWTLRIYEGEPEDEN